MTSPVSEPLSPATSLPDSCDVLVVGAGPAGSACAQMLARGGLQTLLVDAADFPRDKTCGDGLIPDAHAALIRLGVYEQVMAAAQAVTSVRCTGPTGRHVDVPGTLAVLPRRQLDHILVQAAQRAGAQLATPWRFTGFSKDAQGRVNGAHLAQATHSRSVQARHVVLATGASSQALAASGMCEQAAPAGFGLRGYVRNPAMATHIQQLDIVWHPRLKEGYGWIFPCGNGLFNIGVGYWTYSRRNSQIRRKKNLRAMLDDFVALHPPARELMHTGTVTGPFSGAPLRVSLRGARPSAPGVLLTGEAVGSTYSFTGEGIGKAMETGMLAAQVLLDAYRLGLDDATVSQRYAQALGQLQPTYDFYEKANMVNAYPWLAEIVIRSADRNPAHLQRLSDLLDEKLPSKPLTLGRLLKRLIA